MAKKSIGIADIWRLSVTAIILSEDRYAGTSARRLRDQGNRHGLGCRRPTSDSGALVVGDGAPSEHQQDSNAGGARHADRLRQNFK